MKKQSFLTLVDKFLEGKCTLKEQEYIFNYFESFQNKENTITNDKEIDEELRLKILKKIKQNINTKSTIDLASKKYTSEPISKRIFKSNLFKYAATLLLLFGLGYVFTLNKVEDDTTIIETTPQNQKEITLSLPNGNVEVISENGKRKVYNANGKIIGVQKGNQLNYTHNKNEQVVKLVYNELTIPYGKQFDLVLSDGTNVKLNAGTSIKYPVQFIKGKDRKVFIKGEAYFDVKKDTEHPFIVNANNINIEVLGTEFNVSFYPEDQNINTVLVEGSVKLYEKNKRNQKNETITLTPGYKAAWSKNQKEMSLSKVDVNLYTAWKDGDLLFKNTTFSNIIKKLERKFNVTIDNKYAFLNQQIYTASFLNNETIENILEYFKEETSFKYVREDNTITIITNLTK